LLTAARDEDEYVRRAALAALEQCRDLPREVIPELVGWLEHQNSEVMQTAMEILSGLSDVPPEVVPAIRRCLLQDTNRCGGDAVEALGKLHYRPVPEDLPPLLEVLQFNNTQAAYGAARLLARLGEVAVSPLIDQLAAEPNQVKSCAAFALGEIGPPASAALPTLATLLPDPDMWVRVAALGAIGKIATTQEALLCLRPCFRDKSARIRRDVTELCTKLGRLGVCFVQDLLYLIRTEDDFYPKQFLGKALAAVAPHSAEVVPLLVQVLHEPDGAARLRACDALAEIGAGAAAAVADLLGFLEADDSPRRAAMHALSHMGAAAARAIPRLMEWAAQPNPLQQPAIVALGNLGPVAAGAIGVLAAALDSEDRWIRYHAIEALGKMGPAAGEVVDRLGPFLQVADDEPIQRTAATAIAAIRGGAT
jgi:HEAT repeat protein